MKKKIIIGIFLSLILITTIVFIVEAINTYNYEVTNDDIMAGFGAVMIAIVGSFVIFYELDLFYTVYYFFLKPKSATKSILNVISNLTLFIIFFSDGIANFLYRCFNAFKEDWILPIALLLIYIILRIVCAVIPVSQPNK